MGSRNPDMFLVCRSALNRRKWAAIPAVVYQRVKGAMIRRSSSEDSDALLTFLCLWCCQLSPHPPKRNGWRFEPERQGTVAASPCKRKNRFDWSHPSYHSFNFGPLTWGTPQSWTVRYRAAWIPDQKHAQMRVEDSASDPFHVVSSAHFPMRRTICRPYPSIRAPLAVCTDRRCHIRDFYPHETREISNWLGEKIQPKSMEIQLTRVSIHMIWAYQKHRYEQQCALSRGFGGRSFCFCHSMLVLWLTACAQLKVWKKHNIDGISIMLNGQKKRVRHLINVVVVHI